MEKLSRPGQRIFALAIIALGGENLIVARSREDALPVLPWLPPVFLLAAAFGAVLVVAGFALALRRRETQAAVVLAGLLLICLLMLQLPKAIAAPLDLSIRTGVFEILSLAAAAAMLSLNRDGENAGRLLFALSSIVFGITHLLIPNFIATLVPAWMPAHFFLAWFTGLAMIAAGLAIGTTIAGKPASMLLALMYFIIFASLHVPRVLSADKRGNPDEWSSAFICLGMSGAALICARLFPLKKTGS